jgi:hypothetical protein
VTVGAAAAFAVEEDSAEVDGEAGVTGERSQIIYFMCSAAMYSIRYLQMQR